MEVEREEAQWLWDSLESFEKGLQAMLAEEGRDNGGVSGAGMEGAAGGRVIGAGAVLALPVMENSMHLKVSHFLSLSRPVS